MEGTSTPTNTAKRQRSRSPSVVSGSSSNKVNSMSDPSALEKGVQVPKYEYERRKKKSTISNDIILEENETRAKTRSAVNSSGSANEIVRKQRDRSSRDNRYESNGSLSSNNRSTDPKRTDSTTLGNVNLGYNGSVGSATSLTVVQEQYCACTRWSKLEKILLTMVSILAFMVVLLVIAVGILADAKKKQPNWWVF